MTDGGTADPVRDRLFPPWLATYLTGLAMGIADAVPGVSGGTIALIAGIYDRLVGAIAAFDLGPLVDAVERRDAAPVFDLLVEMDVRFLVALGAGAVTGIAAVSRVIEVAYEQFTAPTYAFFFGLIAASAVVLFGEVSLGGRREKAAALAGFAVGFLAAGEFSAALPTAPLVVLFAGAVSICAMILPGVSGSFVLLVLGLHEFLANRLNEFVTAVLVLPAGGSLDDVLSPAVFVVAYGVGAVLGLLTFARVVEAALERDRAATLTFLVALMVGALRKPGREILASTDATPIDAGVVVAAAIAGAGAVLALEHFTGGVGYED